MSLMKAFDGRLYNVPDDKAQDYLIPADKVSEMLEKTGVNLPRSGNLWFDGSQVEAYGWGRNMLAATAAAGMLAVMPTSAEAGGGVSCGGGGRSPGGHIPSSHVPSGHVSGHGPGGRVDHWPRTTPMVVYTGGGYAPVTVPAAVPAVTYAPRSLERFTSTFSASDAYRIASAVGGFVSGPRFWRNSPEGAIYIWDVYK